VTPPELERDHLVSEFRRAFAGLESVRRYIEGGYPFDHDYPKQGSPAYVTLGHLDDAVEATDAAARVLELDPEECKRPDL
jgi:hypothetical protein